MKIPKLTCECGRKRTKHIWPNGKQEWRCHQCQMKKQREYRRKNTHISKAWRSRNIEKLRTQGKEYRLKHYDRELERSRAKYRRYKEKEPWRFKEWYESFKNTPKSKLKSYRQNAKNRGIKFDMTFEYFMTFWKKACTYCGDLIEFIGIDRIDNTRGYIKGNVASCCSKCNHMKRNWTVYEFVRHCYKVVKRHSPK